MGCREAIYVDESTIDFPIFLVFFNTNFPMFPIFSILRFLFPCMVLRWAGFGASDFFLWQRCVVLRKTLRKTATYRSTTGHISNTSIACIAYLGERSEPRKNARARGRGKESLQRSLINFHFHPGNPGTPQSVKIVTANVPQIRKVTADGA